METTTESSGPLFKSLKKPQQRSEATLRAWIDEGQRRVISKPQAKATSAFKLENMSVGGNAVLVPEPAHWQQIEVAHVIARIPPCKAKRLA